MQRARLARCCWNGQSSGYITSWLLRAHLQQGTDCGMLLDGGQDVLSVAHQRRQADGLGPVALLQRVGQGFSRVLVWGYPRHALAAAEPKGSLGSLLSCSLGIQGFGHKQLPLVLREGWEGLGGRGCALGRDEIPTAVSLLPAGGAGGQLSWWCIGVVPQLTSSA